MADAACARDLDRLADVKREVRRRHEAEPELACVQRDRHVLGKEGDDLHVPGVVAARHQIVLGLDEVERDHHLRLRANECCCDRGLHEHVVERTVAQDL